MSDFEDVKPYTQAELDQQAIWANEFDQWWENEGQYQRAGGGQYERTFAWWAWLNQEQKQQAIIDQLKAQLNNMETCYIEKKKECEELQGQIDASKSSQPKLHKTEIGDCLHFSTTMFHDGKATCFDCDAVVNHKREVIGVMQTKALRGAND